MQARIWRTSRSKGLGVIEIIEKSLTLSANIGRRKQILLQEMDVKTAFRQVGITPRGEESFAYQLEDLIFVHLRFQFMRHGSPE